MQLSSKQEEYIRQSHSRWNLKVGAVRSGKSFVDVCYIIPKHLRELKNESGLNVILGVSKETIERNVLEPMRDLYGDKIVGTINSRNIANICGQDVYCLGAEKKSQVSKIQGASIKYAYGDEIAKWNKEVFEMLKSRLDKPYSRFDGSCNPEYPTHWLKEFIDKEGLNKYIQKYTIYDNPFLTKEFVEDLCNEYEGTVYFDRYILGEWTRAEGLIYPMWEQAIEEMPEDSEVLDYILSIDYGTLNAFACMVWAKTKDKYYAIDMYYYSGRETGQLKTDEEYAKAVNDLCKPYIEKYKSLYGEGYKKIKTIIDPSAASFITLMRKQGYYKVLHGDNAVADGIRDTASAMQTDKIKISPRLKEWKDEVQGYVWDENIQAEERPIKINDHCMDATRYLVKTMKVAVHRRNV